MSLGGLEYDISVGGKIYHFEMHPYCGPIWIKKNGSEQKKQPMAFLKAASLWAQQGRKVENGLCVWHHKAKPILKHLSGRHYMHIGEEDPVRGE